MPRLLLLLSLVITTMSYWGKSQAELNAKELEERRKFKGIGMPIKLKLPHTCADGLLEYDTNQVAERIIVESNAGINVVGSYEPPVSSFLGKQASRDQASFSATCDFRPRPDPEYEDFDCPEWGEGLDLDLPPIPSRWLDDIRPVGEMDHGVAGAGADYGIISEEVSASPIADSLLAGAKLATLSEASAGNGLEVARMVETWWGTETGVVKRLMDSGVVDVSVARAATDYASRSNQILGMDNYAGHVRVEKSAVTKEMFTPEEASNLGYQAVVDFGRIIAAVKFSLMMTYRLPGPARESLRGGVMEVNFGVTHGAAVFYHLGDHKIPVPNTVRKHQFGKLIPACAVGKVAESIGLVRALARAGAIGDTLMGYEYFEVTIDASRKAAVALMRGTKEKPKKAYKPFDDLPVDFAHTPSAHYIPITKSIPEILLGDAPIFAGSVSAAAFGALYQTLRQKQEDEVDWKLAANCMTQIVPKGEQEARLLTVSEMGHKLESYSAVAATAFSKNPFGAVCEAAARRNRGAFIAVTSKLVAEVEGEVAFELPSGALTVSEVAIINIANWKAFYEGRTKAATRPEDLIKYQVGAKCFGALTVLGGEVMWGGVEDEFKVTIERKARREKKTLPDWWDDCSAANGADWADDQGIGEVSFVDLWAWVKSRVDQVVSESEKVDVELVKFSEPKVRTSKAKFVAAPEVPKKADKPKKKDKPEIDMSMFDDFEGIDGIEAGPSPLDIQDPLLKAKLLVIGMELEEVVLESYIKSNNIKEFTDDHYKKFVQWMEGLGGHGAITAPAKAADADDNELDVV